MKLPLLILAVLQFFVSFAQKRQELFDYSFKPTNSDAYYYVVTEKEDSIWHRKAYYLSPQFLAMEGWYKDDSCLVEHGLFTWFHSTFYPKSKGHYANGKKQGVWMAWSENGKVIDSSTYQNNKRIGISMHWYENGMARDSLNFDGEGNGVQVSWYEEGVLASVGFWMQDTIKKGRWKYYHRNGAIMATEDYLNGKLIASACYDEKGVKLDSLACIEREAQPADGLQEWNRYIEYNLQLLIDDKARVLRPGNYTVPIRFAVEKNGKLSSFTAFTNYGNELEEELIKILKKSPRWIPAMQHGRTVKTYFTQPFTFNIQSQYQ